MKSEDGKTEESNLIVSETYPLKSEVPQRRADIERHSEKLKLEKTPQPTNHVFKW